MENGKGKCLVTVVLVMCAVILGAYAVQYYTWTAPTQVAALTSTVDLTPVNSECGAMHNGTENWGSDPTASDPASAAESIQTPPDDRIKLGFRVLGTSITGTKENFADLDVQINLYILGENLEVQTYNENCLLADVVHDGTAEDVQGYLDNTAKNKGPGFEPGITLDAVVHISENTQAVENTRDPAVDNTVNLEIEIWTEEV